ncbi:Uncharacterised protein [Mycobacteroides abscessus]|nr:Uncharacterised protein [Mycobacteroides abscessus]
MYHSSNRSQTAGRCAVEGWPGLSTRIVAVCCCGWLTNRAPPPVSWLYQGTVCIVSVAACRPTNPPPPRM